MKHIQIYNLDSDSNLLDELSIGLRERNIDQKFTYTGEGANLYYQGMESHPIYVNSTLNRKEFAQKIHKSNIKRAIISLGCGNSDSEINIFNKYFDENNDYFGIDSSYDMLLLSKDKLENETFNSSLICADFGKKSFRTELNYLTSGYEDRVFIFFSNTFGNIKHTNIIDILSNLLKTGEKIWLDVRIRKGKTIEEDLEISNIISDNLKRDETIQSHLKILNDLGLNKEDGSFSVKTSKETFINALAFEYFFTLNKKKEINMKGDNIIILPGEKIKVFQIYSYDCDGLEDFFNEHGFKLMNKEIKGYRGQFLFEKK